MPRIVRKPLVGRQILWIEDAAPMPIEPTRTTDIERWKLMTAWFLGRLGREARRSHFQRSASVCVSLFLPSLLPSGPAFLKREHAGLGFLRGARHIPP